jgi:hypothetical protein
MSFPADFRLDGLQEAATALLRCYARHLRVYVELAAIRKPDDWAFSTIVTDRADALFVLPTPTLFAEASIPVRAEGRNVRRPVTAKLNFLSQSSTLLKFVVN